MTFIKDNYPTEKYETVFGELWKAMWEEHWDLSKPDKMAECLSRHLSNADVKKIMEGANTPESKKKLNDTTQKALDSGAFGCPWFQVTNKEGVAEPFFGSDRSVPVPYWLKSRRANGPTQRFHYMWQHLGVPWQDIAIQEKSSL
jgi:glutathione S-transferase kappa 1